MTTGFAVQSQIADVTIVYEDISDGHRIAVVAPYRDCKAVRRSEIDEHGFPAVCNKCALKVIRIYEISARRPRSPVDFVSLPSRKIQSPRQTSRR